MSSFRFQRVDHVLSASLQRFHYTCVKVREAQVQLIGEYVELVDEKSSGEEKYGGGLVMRGRVYLAPYALEDVSANI